MSEYLYCFEIELIESLENVVDDFYQQMIESGLKESTAEKHASNADLFLIQYHAVYYLEGPSTLTAEKIYDFLGLWYYQKINQPSASEISSILTSLKRLFNFLHERGFLHYEQLMTLREVLKDKEHFLAQFEEYKQKRNTSLNSNLNSSKTPHDDNNDMISEMSDYLNLDEEKETRLNKLLNQQSLDLMIEELQKIFQPIQKKDNVIQLMPDTNTHNNLPPMPQRAKYNESHTSDSLIDLCMLTHRSNLVFIRWLDRFQCSPESIPKEPFSVCLLCDSILETVLVLLENKAIKREDYEKTHELIDLIDRILWKARHDIAHDAGLDLRLLAI